MRIEVPEALVPAMVPLCRVIDKSAEFQWNKLRRSAWQRVKLGDAEYERLLGELDRQRNRSLLKRDDRGYWVPSGIRDLIRDQLDLKIQQHFSVSDPSPLPWRRTPAEFFGSAPFEHQERGSEAITRSAGPSTIELPCGTGKSLMLAMALREIGKRAVVLVASKVLADQLFALLQSLLGPKYVGEFNGETKQTGKLITVCSAMATKNLRPGSPAWQWLSEAEVLLGDECHTFAADVLESQSSSIFAAATWRGFVTASKVRGDGREKMLLGVVGPTSYGMTFRQAVERRLLAEPHFVAVEVDSGVDYYSKDPDRMTRQHLYQSEAVADLAADLANGLSSAGYSCLLLVEEFPQAAMLVGRILGAAVLHGGTGSYSVTIELRGVEPMEVSPRRTLNSSLGSTTAERLLERWEAGERQIFLSPLEGEGDPLVVVDVRRSSQSGQELLPPSMRDRSVAEVQADFNELRCSVVVATSAGRVGVDFRPPRQMAVLYLVGGTSEVALIQGMGRGTRPQGKDHFLFIDFDVTALRRHFRARAEIVERIWGKPASVSASDIRRVWGKKS